jgi:hypothetical protein
MVSLLAQAQEVSFPTSAFVPLAVGFFGLGTGLWLMYLTWATMLNIASGHHLPL